MRKKYYIRTFGEFAEQYGWAYEDINDEKENYHWVKSTKREIEFRIQHNRVCGEFFKAKKIYEIDMNDKHFNLKFRAND